MKSVFVQLVALAFYLFTASTAGASQKSFEICGTGDSQDLLRKLAVSYTENHPDVSIKVPDSVGSSGGIRKVAEGLCAIGRVARKIKEKEKKYNLTYKLFARSPVVFITNPNITTDNITTQQAIEIFSGKIDNWKDIGGSDAPIYIAKRERGDSSRSVIEKEIPALKELAQWAGKTTYTTRETVETVQSYKNTISIAPLAMAQKVHILKFNDIAPSLQNVNSGKYPLSVPLGLVWKGQLDSVEQDFIDFILSPAGKKIISDSGAIPAE